jgi:probable phosphomutase (TIGR03848 family)
MSRIVLLRHAHSTANLKNILAGRTPGVLLSRKGEEQSINLIERIGSTRFDAVVVSPIQRCLQTITPWLEAEGRGLIPHVDDGFSEVDYGDWTGKSLAVLRRKKLWSVVQDHPSQMVFPGGESLLAMQSRAVAAFHRVDNLKGKNPRLIVSHGDVIKAIVAHVLGMHLDQFQRLIVDPASITVIETDNGVSRLISFNDQKSTVGKPRSTGAVAIGGSTGNDK